MPEMQGTQLVSEVFLLSPQTVGLLMTGGVRPRDVPKGVAVLRKPFSIRELILAVGSSLARSAELQGRMRELAERNQRLRRELQEAVRKSIDLRVSSDNCGS